MISTPPKFFTQQFFYPSRPHFYPRTTMTHSLQHRDIAGSHLSPGDHCLVTEHNRIILARVIQVYDHSNFVQLQPLNSDAGGRRSRPSQRRIRRECYNVYRIPDTEITMSILRGAV